MLFSPIPSNEVNRLQALQALNILDTPQDIRFDCITRFAAEKLHAPICLVTLIDKDRQWCKSSWGIKEVNTSRNLSFCAHAICETTNHQRGRIVEYADMHDDSRFFDHPFVVNKPWVRSYIGFILQSDTSFNVGVLCLLDIKPRRYDDDEINLIIELGQMTEELLIQGYYTSKDKSLN